MLNVYIGYDRGEKAAWKVCRESLLAHASIPVNVVRLDQDWLRRIGLYRRQFYVEDGQRYDTRDGRPFSTEFSFTRFLVPSLQPEGLAVFVDSDFLWRADIAEMIGLVDPAVAVSVCKHQFAPKAGEKMRGQMQQPYPRKNWSSLMIWNCDHPLAQTLTPYTVNTSEGRWLHGFAWLRCEDIGGLPLEWNWLEGHSALEDVPKAVHFTRGTPDMPGWEKTAYSDEWLAYWSRDNAGPT